MSRFLDTLVASARANLGTDGRGLTTGEPEDPERRTWGQVHADALRLAGALGHEVCKGECCLCGGVVLRLVLGVAQNQLRARLVLYRLMAAAGNRQRQHRRTEQSGKHLAAGHGWTSRAAFAASLRY